MSAAVDPGAATFDPLRPKLIRVAYRMLGSIADAEDVVQDAYLRWRRVDHSTVAEPEGYLTRVVTRLSLDVLKSAPRRRETYIGPWLPEPVVQEADDDEVDDVTLPLLLALERLSPLERAAFLLHDVFGMEFDAVAETIGRTAVASRQLASRAREHVRASRPHSGISRERGLQIAEAFFDASRSGDLGALQAMLAADVRVHSDGGGQRRAALRVVEGQEDALRLHEGLARRYLSYPSRLVRFGLINGLPGFVTREADGLLQTTALEIEGGRIAGVFIVRNPDKLQRLAQSLPQ
ncbi:MAG: sigma-70 family RNA polymerase sigma factor [Caulobacteraceae bacterium]